MTAAKSFTPPPASLPPVSLAQRLAAREKARRDLHAEAAKRLAARAA
ncbi:hypothetical protein [Actinoplanes auranticolor]|uniref:Uncharacterized protein n=1 Tax=Actinoplanes auranticolor TaxID=47988 RepID=A0A919SUJ6_9ACTN|nr:hypothetical protein [Actinoplanes auranticolor]GIM78620.1 hypothetical protein Aau02nite_81760 [Actinoplanes auranticolor]